MTLLEDGIILRISKQEFNKIKFGTKGFLLEENYPEPYEKIKLPNELGRYFLIRFIEDC